MVRIRKREKPRKPGGLLPPVLFLCALGILFLQTLLMGSRDAYRELLSLQFPFLYGVPGDASPASPSDLVDINAAPLPSPSPGGASVDTGVGSDFRLSIERIDNGGEPSPATGVDLSVSAPRVLIYHTHTTEAYTQTESYGYKESSPWRTDDQSRNIVAVGEKLAQVLESEYGIAVIHDTTDHEPPKLSTAYSRSLETMLAYKAEYPSLSLFIDVHRDAYGSDPAGATDFVMVEGEPCARLMFVVGTGEGATGNGYEQMPDFESNYALASAITTRLNEFAPNLTRNIRVKTGRYNQHVSSQCLLVEVGHNANTLEHALNAVDYLAAAIAAAAELTGAGGGSTSFDRVISRWAP